jgi:hypothetical protein
MHSVLPKWELVLQLAEPESQELHQVCELQVVIELEQRVQELLAQQEQELLAQQEQNVKMACRKYLEELQALVLGEFRPLVHHLSPP